MKTQSYFHLKKGDRFEVKELFKDFSMKIKEHFGGDVENLSVLDIGCASGELLYFLKQDLKTQGKVWGFDISEELVKNAYERFGREAGVNFFVDNAVGFKLTDKFDVITMSSVLSYFNDPYPVLANLLNHLRAGGLALISGIFNDYNIDVRLQYKLENEKQWDSGAAINQFSKKNLGEWLTKAGYQYRFTKQIMPFDIPPQEFPIRSWTVNVSGERRLTNGLQLLYDVQILEISKK
ncbi:MAG: class I SAM-dependent methyltransferase [Patescibacteria group bacterium]